MGDGPMTPPPPPPGDVPPPEQGGPGKGDKPAGKSWWKKPWGIGVIAAVGLLVLAGVAASSDDDADDAELATDDQLDDHAEEAADEPDEPTDEAEEPDSEPEPAVDPELVSEICDQALSADDREAGTEILNDRIAAATDEQAERRELRLAVLDECESDVNALPEPQPDVEVVDGPLTLGAANVNFDDIGETEDNLPGMLELHRGAGDDVVDFDGEFPAAVIAAQHTGSSNFQVRAATAAGEGRGVINVIGSYEGVNLADDQQDVIGVDVTADGEWTLLVYALPMAPQHDEIARSYEGQGDAVLVFPFDLDDPQPVEEFDRLTASHDGESNFQVRELLGRGLINEIGAYDGTNRLSGPIFGLEINADGAWTIDFE